MEAIRTQITKVQANIPLTCSPSNIKMLQQQLEDMHRIVQAEESLLHAYQKEWETTYLKIKSLIRETDNAHISWAQKKMLFERSTQSMHSALRQLLMASDGFI